MRRLGLAVGTTVLAALMVFSYMARASDFPAPMDDVILTVSGDIKANSGKDVDFDRAMLAALPQSEINTGTPWTEGVHNYKGVLLKDLLKAVDSQGKEIIARALNDYQTTLTTQHVDKDGALVAMEEDGQALTVRNKGPLWVIFPLTDHPELNVPSIHSAMIWQLRAIVVNP
ncbi:molybdopterin-dependent oxidoreductase [Pokkaliibacter sp. MBI-7]|uniref:molybdopterin-dependent oxidoreductase n=1 Tax=Pokkaliibacter sp. MBI-7 TaxID=3040600 RepID=UPI002448782D|nr:molybdopterin-dependent oxidoreductase [Pokkaliibacter sp. MBI-7]MDH2433760.1 molybdopterin-dependent oxidoreductase [Pokkaliibacter sp. MBI-7]